MKTIAIFLIISIPLFSEINSVNVFWKRTRCEQSCQEILHRYFSQVHAIESAQIDAANNVIRLTWSRQSPFSYSEVKTPLQMAGLGLNLIHVTVTGKIRAGGVDPVLVSSEDGTVFYLISPASPRAPHEQIITRNILGRTLDSGHEATLTQLAERDETVTISGPLFMPHRSPPLTIEIESISVIEQKEETALSSPKA